jgi:3-deoxy-D-manno-octulosonic-acid transferase
MRFIYTIVMYLLTPVILYRLAWRGLRAKAYFLRWKERFGFFSTPNFTDTIWIHAVSVGEFNAAIPLINGLMQRYPEHQFVVTTVTPTGSERVATVYGERVFHVYLPYDLPAAVGRFLGRVKPRLAVVMETEIWPNLFCACRQRNIPIVVANARLSERSLKGYRPVRSLAAMALNCSTWVAAQTQTQSVVIGDEIIAFARCAQQRLGFAHAGVIEQRT